MTSRFLCFLGILCVFVPAVIAADDNALDIALKKLDGTWVPVENTIDGQPTPKDRLVPWKTIIANRQYENQYDGKSDTKGPLKFVAQKDGYFHLDLHPMNGPGEGKVVKCILKFEGSDTFRLCMPAEPDGPRPTELTSEKGSSRILRTYKRAKAESTIRPD